MQVGVVIFKPIANIFELVPLNKIQWIYTITISIIPLVIIELQKKFNEFKFGKVIYKKEKNKEKRRKNNEKMEKLTYSNF